MGNIKQISKHFEDTLSIMAEASIEKFLEEQEASLDKKTLAKKFEEFKKQDPDKFNPLTEEEIAQKFEKLKEKVPDKFNELTKEQLAKKFEEFKKQDPDRFNAIRDEKLAELKEYFSEISKLWDANCTRAQGILGHKQVSVVTQELSDEIFGNLGQITGKVKKDKDSAKVFVKEQDLYKEKWSTEIPSIFEKVIEACDEVRIYNVIAAGPKEMARDFHELVQGLTYSEFDVIKTKLNKSEEKDYQDINISEKTYRSLCRLLGELNNDNSDKGAISEQMKDGLNGSFSVGRKLTSWVEKLHTGNNHGSEPFR